MAVRDNKKSPGPGPARKFNDPQWAWAAYQPDARRPWNLAAAGHLYRRAAFGAGFKQLQQALADGPQRTIDNLLSPPAGAGEFNRQYDDYDNAAAGSIDSLRAWWLRRMIQTPHPLIEKMTLFWHGHFAVSNAITKDPRLMLRYIKLLRSRALGSFSSMLEDVSRDPAVLLGLGAQASRKARPDENFVRPLIHNFTLGPGNYTENDVREAARAFTGWFVLRGKLRYIEREHDTTPKTLLGQTGPFTAEDALRIILQQPATARTIVSRLYRRLISETADPDPALIEPLAQSFAKDYDISKLVETMLRSNLFFSPAAYRRRIKCPVEYALGIVNGLEGLVSTTHLARSLAELGRNIYHPNTVEGWPGSTNWINDATVIARSNLALAMLRGPGPYEKKLDPHAVAAKNGASDARSTAKFLLDVFLQNDLDDSTRNAVIKAASTGDADDVIARNMAHRIVTLPEFNLA